MLRYLILAIGVALTSTAQAAAPATGVDLFQRASCEPGRIGLAEPCAVEGDVTLIAAELLVVKFGCGAPLFAEERAAKYAAADDPVSAAFWRDVASATARFLGANGTDLSRILSK